MNNNGVTIEKDFDYDAITQERINFSVALALVEIMYKNNQLSKREYEYMKNKGYRTLEKRLKKC